MNDAPPPEHVRHKPPTDLDQPRELVLALPQMQSQVNVARVIRAAGCFGVRQVLLAGQGKIDAKIARDAVEFCQIHRHRTLPPVLSKWRAQGYRLVGLEQATRSHSLFDYQFAVRTVLVIGHERNGMDSELLTLMDDVVEIPVYGQPASYNAATSAILGMYEYCRQIR